MWISENYDLEPVVYCTNCLSLKVMALDEENDYCDTCGGTETATTDIYTWREMWENKHGKPF